MAASKICTLRKCCSISFVTADTDISYNSSGWIFLKRTKFDWINSFMTESVQNKSIDWFLYDNGLRQERVKGDMNY